MYTEGKKVHKRCTKRLWSMATRSSRRSSPMYTEWNVRASLGLCLIWRESARASVCVREREREKEREREREKERKRESSV